MNKYIKKLYELFDTNGYQKYEYNNGVHIYYFKTGDYQYKCYFDKMLMNSYFLSFCLVEDGEENYKIMNDNNIMKFKVLGIIKNIVDEFILKNNIDFLGFVSDDPERRWIYLNFGKHLSSEYNMDLYGKVVSNRNFFWVIKKDVGDLIKNKYVEQLLNSKRKK